MNCLFCSIIETPDLHKNPEDEVIEETENFYAKPALGQFIEGYTLINSKKHYNCFACISATELNEFDMFKQKIIKRLSNIYSLPVIVFEHGGAAFHHRSSNCAGCIAQPLIYSSDCGGCIDHAHMHLIPFDKDIHNLLKENFDFERIEDLVELLKYQAENLSYLYYESTNRERFVFKVDEKLPSQFLRKLVCEILGQPNVWNWAKHPFRDKIQSFKKVYYNQYFDG